MLLKNAVLLVLTVLLLAFYACNKFEAYDKTAQLQLDIDSIQRFLTKKNLTMTKDASGIFYNMVRTGTGTQVLGDFDTVKIAYTGKMLNDSIVEQAVDSAKLVLFAMPEGFRRGLQIIPAGTSHGIQAGGEIRFIVPSALAYINRPVYTPFPIGIIPPNSNLDYTVQLLQIYKQKK
ncbi:FKBP-type peptidyl-prolyl cis-trans isomerase [Pedobacter sp. MC2016-14]|uniref:FKBP-type peptidyl-prolyl cis-trans isomerase n=1 Tax=Pedobacter sp. MC2016-14 TaxID=2897327 RepID=UPI001E647365|nr:FKBP-type peptidyl-prolyl cis-trans isomerase [Pedobacter sp. MC2016-14]MCD0486728.1 FKBP-type peptidyl-prolyl cis-trans isomerase [Pedobacter sp. MC2016-14]